MNTADLKQIVEMCNEAARNARAEALEEAARVAEGGRFLHDDAPTARFGRECAAAIRRLKDRKP